MEVIIFLILIVIIIINSSVSKTQRKSIDHLHDNVNRLLQESKEIKEEIKPLSNKGNELKLPPVIKEKILVR